MRRGGASMTHVVAQGRRICGASATGFWRMPAENLMIFGFSESKIC
jgi:hypothetical protein